MRSLAIFVLALVLSIIFFASPAIRNRAGRPLVCLFPPEGLELPAGQGIEIPCYLQIQSAATIELLVDGARVHVKQVQPGDNVALGWIPEQSGAHTLAIVVRKGSREVARASCRVAVVSAGSRVRVPQE